MLGESIDGEASLPIAKLDPIMLNYSVRKD